MNIEKQHKRLFIAIDFPEHVKNSIRKLEGGLPRLKWANLNQLHLTLRFIGDAGPEQAEMIQSALRQVSENAFEFEIGGTGFFPNRKRPSVFWLGIQPGHGLSALKEKIDYCLERFAGIPPEQRDFAPHITLLRFRSRPHEEMTAALEDNFSRMPSAVIPVERFILYSSELNNTGAIHRVEAEYRLSNT